MNNWLRRRPRQDALRLYVASVDRPLSTVFFEPWGSEYQLKAGDRLQLQSSEVEEVAATDDGIIIWFRADDPLIVNRAGKRIPI